MVRESRFLFAPRNRERSNELRKCASQRCPMLFHCSQGPAVPHCAGHERFYTIAYGHITVPDRTHRDQMTRRLTRLERSGTDVGVCSAPERSLQEIFLVQNASTADSKIPLPFECKAHWSAFENTTVNVDELRRHSISLRLLV